MKHTILVTGGAGYIGSHTILELLEKTDFDVISIDNYSNSSSETYQRIKKITQKEVEYYNFDLCDKEALFNLLDSKRITGIIHFAAFKSIITPSPATLLLKEYIEHSYFHSCSHANS